MRPRALSNAGMAMSGWCNVGTPPTRPDTTAAERALPEPSRPVGRAQAALCTLVEDQATAPGRGRSASEAEVDAAVENARDRPHRDAHRDGDLRRQQQEGRVEAHPSHAADGGLDGILRAA